MLHYHWMSCDCGYVLNGPYDAHETPAPCCGATDTRTLWPTHRHSGAVAFVRRVDATTDEGSRTACLFLAALLEALTEDTIWSLLARLKAPRPVAFALMDFASGRDKLLAVYKKLTGVSAANALDAKGLGDWFKSWSSLTMARNDVAHGDWYTRELPKPLSQLVDDVRPNALVAMVELRNAGLDAIKAM